METFLVALFYSSPQVSVKDGTRGSRGAGHTHRKVTARFANRPYTARVTLIP